jgi:hypothetical protein
LHLREQQGFGKPEPFFAPIPSVKISNACMKQPDAEKHMHSAGIFVPLSGGEAVRTVCAALVLASLAALFRIVSIW